MHLEAMSPDAVAEPPSIMTRLRDATREAHMGAEGSAFSRALMEESLPPEVLLRQLDGYLQLHLALEEALDGSRDRSVRAVWRRAVQARAHLISDDLSRLGPSAGHDSVGSSAIEALIRRVRREASAHPIGLLGHLYVVEGATLGHLVLRRHAAAVLGVDVAALAYYTADGRQTRRRWAGFMSRMNEAIVDAEDQAKVVAEANASFAGIGAFLREIYANGA